jgi:hypothetical protein
MLYTIQDNRRSVAFTHILSTILHGEQTYFNTQVTKRTNFRASVVSHAMTFLYVQEMNTNHHQVCKVTGNIQKIYARHAAFDVLYSV